MIENIKDLEQIAQWCLCFGKTGEKIPVVVSKKWIEKVKAVYPDYFEPDNEDYIQNSDNLWLQYTSTVNEKGNKVYSGDLANTAATENFRSTWLTYSAADKICRNSIMLFPIKRDVQFCMGFVFTKNLGLTIIDFDRKDGITQQEVAYQDEWIRRLQSYMERSVSGLGYHVIINGIIDPVKYPNSSKTGSSGIRSGKQHKERGIVGFELYSQDRFAVMTGDKVEGNDGNIYNRQDVLDELCEVLKKPVSNDTVDTDMSIKVENNEDLGSLINWTVCEIMNSPDCEMFLDLFNNRCNYDYTDPEKMVCNPDYHLTFPSRSEADFALFAIIVRYCNHADVMKGIFAQSELAKRAKATRIDYVNRIIDRVRADESVEYSLPFDDKTETEILNNIDVYENSDTDEIEKEAEKKALVDELINKKYLNIDPETVLVNSKWQNEKTDPEYTLEQLFADTLIACGIVTQLKRINVIPSAEYIPFYSDEETSYKRLLDKGYICTKGFNITENNALIVPPVSSGLVYELTKWSYASRIKPVLEVSLASVIGIISGIAGKMWQLPTGTGLNNYVILCARSGIGKEGLHTTKNDLVYQMKQRYPTCRLKRHIIDDDFVSAQALVKRCAQEAGAVTGQKQNNMGIPIDVYASFVNFQKEFGKVLGNMADNTRDSQAQGLRGQYLKLYTASAKGDVLSGMSYSSSENNVSEVNAPAFSLVGETTISGLADALTPTMAADGFLSRFLTITYKGKSVFSNYTGLDMPIPDYILEEIHNLCVDEDSLSGQNAGDSRFVTIKLNSQAEEFNNRLERWCLEMLDQAGDAEHYRQSWNRCRLKILRLAGICAVSQNHTNPVINIQHMAWAMRVVMLDIANMYSMIISGETNLTANNEQTMAGAVLEACRSFIRDKGIVALCSATNLSGDVIKKMKDAKVVPLKYLHFTLSKQKVFSKYRFGYTKAINSTLERLCADGSLEQVSKALAFNVYKTKGACYKLLDQRGC